MDATKSALEQTKKDRLAFPTDAAALLFGLLVFSVAIFALHRAFLIDPDTYWHIATGKWMLTERAFPRHEIFSHTAAGQPWVNIEWLAQIILFSIYDWFGWRGLVLLCGISLDSHGIRSSQPQHTVQRGAQVVEPGGTRTVGVFGDHLEKPAADDVRPLGEGGAQISIAGFGDGQIGGQHQVGPGNGLKHGPKVRDDMHVSMQQEA
jgi:hypothetical protein